MTFDTSGATIRLRLRGGHRLRQRLGCLSGSLSVGVAVFAGILEFAATHMGLCAAIVRTFQTFAASDVSQMQRRDVQLWLSLLNLLDSSVVPSNYLVDTQ